jgi:hypothetical protein
MNKCDCVRAAGHTVCRLKAWKAEVDTKILSATHRELAEKIISDLEKICRKNVNNVRTG